MCSGIGFANFVTVQYLSHIIGSFMETVLTRQEVVLRYTWVVFSFSLSAASIILQSNSWHLAKVSLRVARRCRVMAHVILAYPSFLKLVSVRDMVPIYWFCILISSLKDDMISNGKATRNFRESSKQ